MKQRTIQLLFFILCSGTLLAHGDLHERIVKLTQKIDSFPNNSELHFQRGKLYFHHEDFVLAIEDIEFALELDYEDNMAFLILAKSHLAIEDPNEVISICEKILAASPDNVHFNKVVAQSYYQLEDFHKSGLAYEKVLAHALRTFPENYISAADAWQKIQTTEADLRAVTLIDQGISELGNLPSLLAFKLELFLSNMQYQKAIEVQIAITELSPRKERAYYKLAQLYEKAELPDQASDNYKLALKSWNLLPLRIRSTAAMIELHTNINASILNN